MLRFMRAVRPGLSWLSLACLYLAGLGVVLMTIIIGWQVFGRYVLNDTPSWSEPLSLQLMSWFILLGAAVGVATAGRPISAQLPSPSAVSSAAREGHIVRLSRIVSPVVSSCAACSLGTSSGARSRRLSSRRQM